MLPRSFQLLLEKFSRGECTPEEERLVNEWYHNIGEKETSFTHEDEKFEVAQRLWQRLKPVPQRKRHRFSSVYVRAAVIALPVLVAVAIYINRGKFIPAKAPGTVNTELIQMRKVYANTGNRPMAVTLPDGSRITLQPSSEIGVAFGFGKELREVRLKGEGFFDVQRDEQKAFVVYTGDVVTRVLGTSFNIRAYEADEEITVAVRTGKVSVSASGEGQVRKSDVILTPNQQLVYRRKGEIVSKKLVENPEIILPDSDLFRMQFDNAPVSDILEVLKENYGIDIRYDRETLKNCRLTTSMSDEGLYERIAVICKAIGASYMIDDDAAIAIQSNGCEM